MLLKMFDPQPNIRGMVSPLLPFRIVVERTFRFPFCASLHETIYLCSDVLTNGRHAAPFRLSLCRRNHMVVCQVIQSGA
jgi:hypothetical protein